MSKQVIGLGSTANDGTGDPLRTAFTKVNANFTEVYDAAAAAQSTADTAVTNAGTALTAANEADDTADAAQTTANTALANAATNATAIAAETTARGTAISAAVATEVTNRNGAISTAVGAEATARDAAITTAVGAETTARNAALALKANLASPTFTGTPAAPTASAGTNTTQWATTAFVRGEVTALVAAAPGTLDTLNELAAALGNDPSFAATVTNSLAAKAPLASPALTGTPTAPTAAAATSTTQLATTAFVTGADAVHDTRLTALEVVRTRIATVTSDQLSIGSSYADVTSLSFSLEANTTYEFEFNLSADVDATTTGIDVAVAGPASPTLLNYCQSGYSSTTGYLERLATTYDQDTANAGSQGTNARNYKVYGIVTNGATTGNLRARIKREAVGSGPNVRVGSYGRIRKLF